VAVPSAEPVTFRPFSLDLRERVRRACAAATRSRAELARQFEVGESAVYRWLRQAGTEGRRTPKPHAGGRASGFDGVAPRALLAEGNDRTLAELAAAYARGGPAAPAPPPEPGDASRLCATGAKAFAVRGGSLTIAASTVRLAVARHAPARVCCRGG
jgi:transposase-like protein